MLAIDMRADVRETRWMWVSIVFSIAFHVAVLQWLPGIQNSFIKMPEPEIMQVRLMPVQKQIAPAITPPVDDVHPEKAESPRVKQIRPEVQNRPTAIPALAARETMLNSEPVHTIQAAPVAAPAKALSSPKITEPESVTTPDYRAAYLDNPRPEYPLAARRMGLEGRVLLRVEVLENGTCNRLIITESSGHDMLDQAALKAVKNWRFLPAKKGGEAIVAWVEIPIVYRLDS